MLQNISTIQRCKYALQLHFKSWCFANNKFYPINQQDLNSFYNENITLTQYLSAMQNIVKRNKLEYPIDNINKLRKLTSNSNHNLTLKQCCNKFDITCEDIINQIKFERKLNP